MSRATQTAAAFALLFGAAGVHAEEAVDPRVELGLVQAREYCAENTTFRVEPSAFIYVDLTGDGVDDLAIDERGVACESGDQFVEPRLQGSAGTRVVFVVGDTAFRYVAQEWFIVESVKRPYGESGMREGTVPIILLASHGSACDGAGYEGCITALIWQADKGRFNESTSPSPEETWSATQP